MICRLDKMSSSATMDQCTVKDTKGCYVCCFCKQRIFSKRKGWIPTSLWNLCKHGRCLMMSPVVGVSRQIAQSSTTLPLCIIGTEVLLLIGCRASTTKRVYSTWKVLWLRDWSSITYMLGVFVIEIFISPIYIITNVCSGVPLDKLLQEANQHQVHSFQGKWITWTVDCGKPLIWRSVAPLCWWLFSSSANNIS